VQVPKKLRWMVDDNYTDMEDVAIDKDQDDSKEGDCDNNNNHDNGDNNLYSKVMTTKKRKKGARLKPMMSKKRESRRMIKCNTSINHDFVISGEGDADIEGDADGKDSDDDVDLFEEKRYKKTKAKNWTMHKNGRPGREIHPIPFTGMSEFFCPNISDMR
jgi:hypothetical protein